MSTTSLYQKYRPQNFSEVIGQKGIIDTIKNQIDNDQLSHAYLFYGTRGLGKTTVARLMAAELGISNEDLYEIDAASNRGIDDIRGIRDGVKSRPFSSPYKMYLIDEVHMLTKEAFNALLKTLEEPPEYVVFILATTELHKVPATIQSRTQTFTFDQPSSSDLVDLLDRVSKSEKLDLTESSRELLIQRAAGSYRDALSQLQLYSANPDNYGDLTNTTNLVSGFISLMVNPSGDNTQILTDVKDLADPVVLYRNLVAKISEILYLKTTNKSELPKEFEGLNSRHLKNVLDAREYFVGTDHLLAQAGLIFLLTSALEE